MLKSEHQFSRRPFHKKYALYTMDYIFSQLKLQLIIDIVYKRFLLLKTN